MTIQTTLTRLRHANPAPNPDTNHNAELFEKITALPGDPPARGAPRHTGTHRALIVAFALAVTALLVSTAYALSQWHGEAVKPKVTRSEYLHARHQLTLPPGATWPQYHLAPPDTLTGRGGGGGQAVLVSQNAWECYWAAAIKHDDQPAAQRAHEELKALLARNVIVAPNGVSENWTPPNPPNTPYAVFADDGGLEFLKQTYAAAAAGHPQSLIQSCKANRP